MDWFIRFVIVLLFNISCLQSATITWNSDRITVTSTHTQNFTHEEIEIAISSNGMIYDDEMGSFKLNVESINKQGQKFAGQTDCIYVSTTVPTFQRSLNNMRLYFVDSSGNAELDTWRRTQDLYFVDVKRYFQRDNYAAVYPFQTNLQIGFTKRSNATRTTSFTLSYEGCSPMRTVGDWSDSHHWSGQVVPTEDDDVIFMSGAGVALIEAHTTIHSLNMSGGLIVNYKTYCPRGWSVEPEGYTG